MAREPGYIVEMRHALGRQLATFRKAAELTQADLARATSYDRTTVAHVESGRARADARFWDTADRITNAGGALVNAFSRLRTAKHEHEMAVHAAELADLRTTADQYREQNRATSDTRGPTTLTGDVPGSAEGVTDDVKRADFVSGLVAAVAVPGIMFGQTSRIGTEDVRRYRKSLEHLYALDDSYGASGDVYSLTLHTLRKLRRDFGHARYSSSVGQEIHSIAGQLMEHAGWLAFDAGQDAHARHWWLEALHAARMADRGDNVEVVVLASMSVSASRQGHGRQAVDIATAAQRVVKASATPRLVSLLSAREALGHARCGDARSTARALDKPEPSSTRVHATTTRSGSLSGAPPISPLMRPRPRGT